MPATTVDTQAAFNAIWGESITFTRAGVGGTSAITACQYPNDESEGVTSYGVYTVLRETWTFATDALAFTPKIRDTITLSGVTRVITSLISSPWLKFYKATTAYPALAADLDATARVERANPLPDDAGLRDPQFLTVYDDLAVRLQPDTRTREVGDSNRVYTRAKFVCVFGSAVTLDAGDVVVIDEVKYEVTEQSEIESLGLLTFAGVERVE